MLSRNEINDGFMAVLGRPPKTKEVARYYRQKYASLPDLYLVLMETKEFSRREDDLTPSARVILRRAIMRINVFGDS